MDKAEEKQGEDSFTAESQSTNSKAKTTILIIIPAAFAGLSAILAFFAKPTLAFLAAIFGFFAAIGAIKKGLKRKNKVKRIIVAFSIVVLIFSSLQLLILSYLRIDAAPIPDDYTINDIRSAGPEYFRSYILLLSTSDKNSGSPSGSAIGLSLEDINNLDKINNIFKETNLDEVSKQLQANRHIILSIWNNAKKGKDFFAELDSFPEIADLSDPNQGHQCPMDKNFRLLVGLFRAYICLQNSDGNHEEAVNKFIRLDSILKKISLNTRTIIMKFICIDSFGRNIDSANFMINNPETPHETLLILKQHIVSLSNEHTSLRNTFIFDYLTLKKQSDKVSREPHIKYSAYSPFKYNSSLRLLRNLYDECIAIDENQNSKNKLRIWPAFYPNLPVKINHKGKLPVYYKGYNLLGSKLFEEIAPAIKKILQIEERFEIQYDILKIALSKRFGEEVDLKARAYSDEYIIDLEKKIIFSPGPDEKIGTKDDIKLPINPQVLGFTK